MRAKKAAAARGPAARDRKKAKETWSPELLIDEHDLRELAGELEEEIPLEGQEDEETAEPVVRLRRFYALSLSLVCVCLGRQSYNSYLGVVSLFCSACVSSVSCSCLLLLSFYPFFLLALHSLRK